MACGVSLSESQEASEDASHGQNRVNQDAFSGTPGSSPGSIGFHAFNRREGADLTNFREVSVDLRGFGDSADQMRFAFNGFRYGEWQPFSSSVEVKLPSYKGTNWVNVEV